MFELWGDLPDTDFVYVLAAIQAASIAVIALDLQKYRPPRGATPPTENLSA
jgi:hypothetical protein